MNAQRWLILALALLAVAGPARAEGEAPYYLKLGQAAAAAGDYERAVVCFETAQRYAPGDASIEQQLAAAYNNYALKVAAGDLDQGLALLQAAYQLRPEDRLLARNLAALHNERGVQLANAGQGEAALPWFEKAAQLDPENQVARRNAAAVLARAGHAAFAARQFNEAKELLARALALDGNNVNALVTLGYLSYTVQDLTTALQLWRKALALAPGEAQLAELVAKAEGEQAVEGGLANLSSFHFEIRFEGEQRRYDALDVLNVLEEAHDLIGNEFGRWPDHKIAVLIYSAADYQRLTGSSQWTGAIYDGKIRVPAENIFGDRTRLAAILRHEYTHALVHEVTAGNCPTWINEGLAQYFEFKPVGLPPLPELKAALAGNRLLTLDQLSGSFMGLPEDQAQVAYQQSLAMVDSIIRRNGFWSINRILDKCRRGLSSPDILAQEFGLTPAKFNQLWVEHFRGNLAR